MTEQPDPTIGETVILPVYCVEVAELLADTEAHPDPAVRAVRKIVTQAALALRAVYDQTSGSEAPSALPAPSASSEPESAPPARREPKDSQLTLRQRLLILGVDQAAVRAWAAENGISYNRQGPIRLDVLDAYEEAHPVAA